MSILFSQYSHSFVFKVLQRESTPTAPRVSFVRYFKTREVSMFEQINIFKIFAVGRVMFGKLRYVQKESEGLCSSKTEILSRHVLGFS